MNANFAQIAASDFAAFLQIEIRLLADMSRELFALATRRGAPRDELEQLACEATDAATRCQAVLSCIQ